MRGRNSWNHREKTNGKDNKSNNSKHNNPNNPKLYEVKWPDIVKNYWKLLQQGDHGDGKGGRMVNQVLEPFFSRAVRLIVIRSAYPPE